VACLLVAVVGTLTPARQARPEQLAVEVP
jgi:hypothetical protein